MSETKQGSLCFVSAEIKQNHLPGKPACDFIYAALQHLFSPRRTILATVPRNSFLLQPRFFGSLLRFGLSRPGNSGLICRWPDVASGDTKVRPASLVAVDDWRYRSHCPRRLDAKTRPASPWSQWFLDRPNLASSQAIPSEFSA